jgi:aminomethyltransferase
MGRFTINGANAAKSISAILTTNILPMTDNQCRYGFLLREDGGIMDDLIAYRFTSDRWMLVVNAGTRDKDAAWIQGHLPKSVTFENVSDQTGKLDVQGPKALDTVSRVLSIDANSLRYFRFIECQRLGDPLVVSRTGYTGERGVEIYASVPRIQELWNAFLDAGVLPAGLGARDTLRLEAGLPLYGHELNESLTPIEAGMDRYAAKPEPFIGKDALAKRQAAGPSMRLCGFRIEGRQSARAGHRVMKNNAAIGEVTSGSFSPTLQCAIGFAYVTSRDAVPGHRVGIDTGRNLLDAELVNIPVYKST